MNATTKNRTPISTPRSGRHGRNAKLAVGLAAVLLVASGCATGVRPTDCKSAKVTSTAYQPNPRIKSTALAPSRHGVTVPVYRLRAAQGRVQHCTALTIRKELWIERQDAPLSLNETREFFAEDGTLIARTTDDVSAQLPRTGGYEAKLEVPVPSGAPAGRYRLVSRLVAAGLRGRAATLAQSDIEFVVEPRQRKTAAAPGVRKHAY